MPSATFDPCAYVNLKLLRSQVSFAGMTVQVAEPARGGDVGGGINAAILSCTEMLRCALKATSLFDAELVVNGELRGI